MSDKREWFDSGLVVDEKVVDVSYEDISLLMSKAGLDLVCDDPKHDGVLICYSCQDRMETWWDTIRKAARERTTVWLPRPLLHREVGESGSKE